MRVSFMLLKFCEVLLFCFQLVCASSNYTNSSNSNLIQQSLPENFTYKGVAIGGWLVLEPYITPSIFLKFNETSKNESDIPVDEYHFCKKLGQKEAEKRLRNHWDSFYTESDFAEIKSYGLNMVRIPIGYWSFEKMDGDPYVYGAQEYLDKAIAWAHKYNLKVWIDLHGVPGSQNGFDNSGLRNIGHPGWFKKQANVDHTHKVLHEIFSKYGGSNFTSTYNNTIIGIELINEPLSTVLPIKKIKNVYEEAYNAARRTQVVNNTIVIHDAFEPIGFWNDFLPHQKNNQSREANYNILVDHHHYVVFSVPSLNSSIEEQLDAIKSYSLSIHSELKHHPAVVGEWSAALTDCTPWLNGVGLGARYEGDYPYTNSKIGSCDNVNNWRKWTSQDKKNHRKFVEMQLDQYSSRMSGWIFWCFKTETTIEWDFKRLVKFGLMPQPLSSRKYIFNSTDTDAHPKKSSADKNSIGAKSLLFILIFNFFFLKCVWDTC